MKDEKLLIGIDIGTSRAKGLLVNSEGRILARASFDYQKVTIFADAVEQDANEWWEAASAITRELASQVPEGMRVAALSLSTQGGSLVLTDESGHPLAPAVIWQDQRCQTAGEELLQKFSAQQIKHKSGWKLGKGMNLLQLLRIRSEDRVLFESAAYFLSVIDFIALKLTGRPAIDLSNAGINQLADIETAKWDPDLLHFAGIKTQQLPAIIPSGKLVGSLLPDVAACLSLPVDTVLISGGHDQYCAALGAGAVQASNRTIGTGTAWVILEVADQADFTRHQDKAISHHVVPGKWGHLMSLSFGGAALEWIRSALQLRDESGHLLTLSELDQQIESCLIDETRPFFFPYMGGSPYPALNNNNQAIFSQMQLHHDWRHLVASVLEGVVMQVSWMWEDYPAAPESVSYIMTGGATASRVWSQMLANTLNQPLTVLQEADIGCFGAAMLAGYGSGIFPDLLTASQSMVRESRQVRPNEHAEFYQKRFIRFKEEQDKLFG